AVEYSVQIQLSEMRNRLDQAVSIARAAETCAAAGNLPKAIEIALDIDQLLYEATTLLNAAALMVRLRDDYVDRTQSVSPARQRGLLAVPAHAAVLSKRGDSHVREQTKPKAEVRYQTPDESRAGQEVKYDRATSEFQTGQGARAIAAPTR